MKFLRMIPNRHLPFFIACLQIAWSVCPEGFVDPGRDLGRCFKFVKERKSWGDARRACVEENGDLLSYRSIKEKNWMQIQLNAYAKTGWDSWWTGLESLRDPNVWEWVDGTPYDQRLVNWQPGEPNTPDERCGELHTSGFNDNMCDRQYAFICARSKNVPIPCPHGWTLKGQSCYKLHDLDATWLDAQNACWFFGGDLVVVSSEEEQIFSQNLATKAKRAAWMGLKSFRKEGQKSIDWIWVTDENVNSNVTYWAEGQPKVEPGEESNSCGVMLANAEPTKSWSSAVCNETRSYICKRPTGGCEPGWRLFRNHCFRIYTGDDEKAWSESRDFCSSQNAALLTIHRLDRQVFINRFLNVIRESGSESIWLGASYDNGSGQITWVTGAKVDYNNWAPYQPEIEEGRDNCAMINTENGGGEWEMTTNCYVPLAFVCYMQTGVSVIDPTPPPPEKTCDFRESAREACSSAPGDTSKELCENKGCCYQIPTKPGTNIPRCFQPKDRFICPPSWKLHKSSCYLFSEGQPAGWVGARIECGRYQGDLADVRDPETQILLNKYHSDGDRWIGLNDRASDGVYVWLDETQNATWTNWAPGQPTDNNTRTKNCVFASGEPRFGQWADANCGERKNYICKIEATPVPTLPTPTPTAWPSGCGPGNWHYWSSSNLCYQVNKQEVTWFDARAACEDHGGVLASLTSPEETEFVKGILKELGSVEGWIGLDGLQVKGMWRWLDDSPLNFINWETGEPNYADGAAECGAIIKGKATWKTQVCRTSNGYICKKLAADALTPTPPLTIPTAQPGFTVGCPAEWYTFNHHCYRVYTSKKTWQQALQHCSQRGASLVTISNQAEQDFVYSRSREILGNEHPWRIWIGLNDRSVRSFYQWADGSKVTYTNWNAYEPNNKEERCVNFWQEHGRWNDESCDLKALGFVCRSKQKQLPTKPTSTPVPDGCPPGYLVKHGGKCYRIVDDELTWDQAKAYCNNHQANLIDILDNVKQGFVSAYLADKTEPYWIGLKKSENAWKWSSGQPTRYTNWSPSFIGKEDCAKVLSGGRNAGKWEDVSCQYKLGFICEATNTKGVTLPPPPTIDPKLKCSLGWASSGDYCYKSYQTSSRFRRTWIEARDFCRALGGDLASIHGARANAVAGNGLQYKRDNFWIGLNARDPRIGYAWSDGSAFQYSNWMGGQPDSHNGRELCVEYSPYRYKGNGLWKVSSCGLARQWICSIKRGIKPMSTIAPVTAVTNPACGRGWVFYSGKCYFIQTRFGGLLKKTWFDAREYCNQNGGQLTSIHSMEENNFIISRISRLLGIPSQFFWTGLNELDLDGYRWSDNTTVDFLNWDRGQPNDENHAQRCVSMLTTNGFWSDRNCGEKYYFTCKKDLNSFVTVTTEPTPIVPGYCPDHGVSAGNKCYFTIGNENNTALNWDDAELECRKMHRTGDLASISSQLEAVVLEALLGQLKGPHWIGLTDRSQWRRWKWVDNSPVTFTKWAPGQPNGLSRGDRKTSCVEVKDGLWYDQFCKQTRGYICQTFKDPNNVVLTTPQIDVSGCPDKGYRKYGGNCYKLVLEPLRWSDSRTMCARDGADLASVHDSATNSFLRLLRAQSKSTQRMWIGLQDKEIPGYYRWTDNSLAIYANWGPNEPVRPIGGGCVSIDTDGGWTDNVCEIMYPFICKKTLVPGPTQPPDILGRCPSKRWIPFGPYCFLIPDGTQSYSSSQRECNKAGGALTSIHSPEENAFIHSVHDASRYRYDAWIGMLQKGNKYVWDDGSAVQFTNWGPGEPNTLASSPRCVAMVKFTGKWATVTCRYRRRHICKAKKTGVPNYSSTSQLPTNSPPTLPGMKCKYDPEGSAFGDYCYRFTTRMLADADLAEKECQKLNGHLTSVASREENDFIKEMLRVQKPPGDVAYIGFEKTGGGIWMWIDRSSSRYTNWEIGQPGDSGHACAVISSVTGRWSDQDCSKPTNFVCKSPQTPPATGPTSPPPTYPVNACPYNPGSYLFGDYCYKVVMDDLMKQSNARQQCRVRGGDLASVQDRETNDFIVQLISRDPRIEKQDVWVGLIRTDHVCELKVSKRKACGSSDIDRHTCLDRDCCWDAETPNSPKCYEAAVDIRGKYEWRWTDQTKLEYTNWAPKYPTIKTEQACGTLGYYNGQWKDEPCLEQRGHVCRFPYGVPAPSTIKIEACPYRDNAILLGDWCYHVSTTAVITRASARAQCMSQGGDLASIHDGEENAFILNDLMRMNGEVDIYIGLWKQGLNWTWSDGTAFDYNNWGPGEPSLKGECVKFATVTGKWIEVPCSQTNGFVCKYSMGLIFSTTPMMTPTFKYLPCPSGGEAVGFGDYCYHVSTTTIVSWAAASLQCQQMGDGAHLASILDGEENAFILRDLLRMNGEVDIWTGAIDAGRNWMWIDGTKMEYLNWSPQSPVDRGACARMDKQSGKWIDTDCLDVYGYVCKIPIGIPIVKSTYSVTQCPARPEALLYKDACYDIRRAANLNQQTSRDACQSLGGELASFHSQDEAEFVHVMSNRGVDIRIMNLWIGLVRDEANSASWRWLDNTPVDFFYWAGTGPTGTGNCVDMDRVSGRWLNLDCSEQRGYVCKYTAGITTTPIMRTTPKKCPIKDSLWWELGKYCYYVTTVDLVTFGAASDYCKYGGAGGSLASIHSAQENGFIFNQIKRAGPGSTTNPWIGLKKIDGRWQWTDGSPVDYANWSPGRPGLSGDCVDMDRTNGKWMDVTCSSYRGYACKLPEVPPSTMTTPMTSKTTPRRITTERIWTPPIRSTSRRPWWQRTTTTNPWWRPSSTVVATQGVPITQGGINGGSIAAIVIGVILAIGLVLLIIVLVRRRTARSDGPHPDRFNVSTPFSFNNELYTDDSLPALKLEDMQAFSNSTANA